MSYRVQVAPVASNLPTLLPPVGEQGFDMPYQEREIVELDVGPSESLGSVYARAMDHLRPLPDPSAPPELSVPISRVAFAWFYEPDDNAGIDPARKSWDWVEDLITVDQTGLAQWNRSAEEIPYADIVRAAELGLLHGDPLRPYLLLVHPQGDIDFHTAWEITKRTWDIFGHLFLAGEVARVAIGQLERRRAAKAIERGSQTVYRHRKEWAERRAGPVQILKTLERRPWTLDELRMILGLDSNQEAANVLALYGLTPTDKGVYELSADWELVLHAAATDAAYWAMYPTLGPDGHAKRLLHLVETGELPDPWDDTHLQDC